MYDPCVRSVKHRGWIHVVVYPEPEREYLMLLSVNTL